MERMTDREVESYKNCNQLHLLVKCRCYNTDMYFRTRADATDFFMEGMLSSDPSSSECSRYTKILCDLKSGIKVPTDEY